MAVAVKNFPVARRKLEDWRGLRFTIIRLFIFFRKIKTCDKYESLRSEKFHKLQPEEGKSSPEL